MIKMIKKAFRDFGSFAKKKLIDEPKEAQAAAEAQAKRAEQVREHVASYISYAWFVFNWLRERYADYGVQKPYKFREILVYDVFGNVVEPPQSCSFFVNPKEEYFNPKQLATAMEFSFYKEYPAARNRTKIYIKKLGDRYVIRFKNLYKIPHKKLIFDCYQEKMLIVNPLDRWHTESLPEKKPFTYLNTKTGEFVSSYWQVKFSNTAGLPLIYSDFTQIPVGYIPDTPRQITIAEPVYILHLE